MKRAFIFIAAIIWSCCMCAETKNVIWDEGFVENIVAWRDADGTIVHANNSKDSITVTFDGPGKYCGFNTGDIYFYKADALLTFTTAEGYISHIEITGVTHTVGAVFPTGWTWVSGEQIDPMYVGGTLSWSGDPTFSVVMNGSDETISITDISQIVFTVTDAHAAIDEIKQEDVGTPGRKFMKNGQLFIERDGKTYNALGIAVTPVRCLKD